MRPTLISMAVFVSAAAAVLPAATAQDFLVSGVSHPNAATFAFPGESAGKLAINLQVDEGTLEVRASEQVMLYSFESRTVAIVLGPASVSFALPDDEPTLHLASGRLQFVSRADEPDIGTAFSVGGTVDAPLLRGRVQPGRICLSAVGETSDVTYEPVDGEPLVLDVGGEERPVAAGKRFTLRAGDAQTQAAAGWLTDQGFEEPNRVQRLGVYTAQLISRDPIEDRLISEVVSIDLYSTSDKVIESLSVTQFRPEIRALTVAITPQVTTSTNLAAAAQSTPFPAANEVPPLSPAAVSVGGVTALQLNQSARNLLTITGSRGLGFNGPSRLALPGFGPGGVRTVGPPGLGAQ